MTLRRSALCAFCALALVLLSLSCSDNGDSSNGERTGPLATLQASIQTAEASGTLANAPRPTTTPVPQSDLSGDYESSLRFQQPPTDEDLLDALEMPENIELVIGEGILAISGDPPFIEVTGTITADGAISATGNGSIDDDYTDITATFEGTLVGGRLTGTYTLAGDTLPGSPIVFDAEARFDD